MNLVICAVVFGGLLSWMGCDHDDGGHDRIHSQPTEETDTKKAPEKPHKEARLKHLKPTPDYPEK